jgi:hypothetical protein
MKNFPQRTAEEWLAYWQKCYAEGRPGNKQASIGQTSRITAIARERGVDDWAESKALFGCLPGALCVGASITFADWLASESFVSAIIVTCCFCKCVMDAKSTSRVCMYCVIDEAA